MSLITEGRTVIGETIVDRNYKNLALDALVRNDYLLYLPSFGYIDPNNTDSDHFSKWKQKADSVTTPRVIATIYRSLYNRGLIPSYGRPESFVMVSYGSNIPTYERFIFDLDRKYRKSATKVLSVDLEKISQSFLSTLTVGKQPDLPESPLDNIESVHQFIQSEEEKYVKRPESVDLIWNYRASLYYYIENYIRGVPELLQNAAGILQKYHHELRKTGCVVVDAPEEKAYGKPFYTEMYNTTGDLILDFAEELNLDQLFNAYHVGNGQSRILVLGKKTADNANSNHT